MIPGSCRYSQHLTRNKKRRTSLCFFFQSSSIYCTPKSSQSIRRLPRGCRGLEARLKRGLHLVGSHVDKIFVLCVPPHLFRALTWAGLSCSLLTPYDYTGPISAPTRYRRVRRRFEGQLRGGLNALRAVPGQHEQMHANVTSDLQATCLAHDFVTRRKGLCTRTFLVAFPSQLCSETELLLQPCVVVLLQQSEPVPRHQTLILLLIPLCRLFTRHALP